MNGTLKKEIVMSRQLTPAIPDWWSTLSAGEKMVIHAVVKMLRGAKRSRMRDVAQAAAKWERGIGCFIKVRLIHSHRRGTRPQRLPPRREQRLVAKAPVTSSPSNGRNPPGAVPNPD